MNRKRLIENRKLQAEKKLEKKLKADEREKRKSIYMQRNNNKKNRGRPRKFPGAEVDDRLLDEEGEDNEMVVVASKKKE
jgi:hypothetical protein